MTSRAVDTPTPPDHVGVHRAGYREDCPACLANDAAMAATPDPSIPERPDREALADAMQRADRQMRDETGRHRTRNAYYWRDLADVLIKVWTAEYGKVHNVERQREHAERQARDILAAFGSVPERPAEPLRELREDIVNLPERRFYQDARGIEWVNRESVLDYIDAALAQQSPPESRPFRTAPMKDGIRYDAKGEPIRESAPESRDE